MENTIKACNGLIGLMSGLMSDETLKMAIADTNATMTPEELLTEMKNRYVLTQQQNHPAMGRVWRVYVPVTATELYKIDASPKWLAQSPVKDDGSVIMKWETTAGIVYSKSQVF